MDPELIEEGVELITAALPRGPVGPYQLQAAIAAVHDEAPSAEETDWAQIVALYEVLLQLTDNPMVALNHVVAVAMARGADDGLVLLALDRGRRADREGSPVVGGAGPSAGDVRGPGGRAGGVRGGGEPDDQLPAAALPQHCGGRP